MLHSCFPHRRSEHVQEKRLIWGVENPAAKTEPDPAEKPDDTEVDPGETDEQLEPEEGAKESPAGPREGAEEPVEDPEDLSKKGVDAAGKAMERPQANNEKAQRVTFESQLDFVNSPDEKNRLVNMYEQMPPMQKRITVLALGGVEGNDKKARFVELMGKFSPEHNAILQKVAGDIAGQAAFLERLMNKDQAAVDEVAAKLELNDQLKLKALVASFDQEGDAELLKEGLRKAAEQQKEQHGDQLAESFAKFLTMLSEFMEKIAKFFQDIEKAMKGKYHKEGSEAGSETIQGIDKKIAELDKKIDEIQDSSGRGKLPAAKNELHVRKAEAMHPTIDPSLPADKKAEALKLSNELRRQLEEDIPKKDQEVKGLEAELKSLTEERDSLVKKKEQLTKELSESNKEKKPAESGALPKKEEKKDEKPKEKPASGEGEKPVDEPADKEPPREEGADEAKPEEKVADPQEEHKKALKEFTDQGAPDLEAFQAVKLKNEYGLKLTYSNGDWEISTAENKVDQIKKVVDAFLGSTWQPDIEDCFIRRINEALQDMTRTPEGEAALKAWIGNPDSADSQLLFSNIIGMAKADPTFKATFRISPDRTIGSPMAAPKARAYVKSLYKVDPALVHPDYAGMATE